MPTRIARSMTCSPSASVLVARGPRSAVTVPGTRRPYHPDVDRPVREDRDGGLGDVEAEPAVVLDVGQVRGLQVAGQAGLVGQGESGRHEHLADTAALSPGMHPEC